MRTPGGGGRIVGGVPHVEGAGDGDQGRHAAGADGIGDRHGGRQVIGRVGRRPRRVGGQLAGPQQLGHLLVGGRCATGRRRRGRGSSTPDSSSVVTPVTIWTSSDGRGSTSRRRTAPDERLDVVHGVHRRPPVDGDAAFDEAPADVGVQRGLLDPEQASGLAGSHEAAHGVDGSARVNVDLINVDHRPLRDEDQLMTTLIDVPPGLNGVAVTDTSIGDVDGEAGFFHYRGLDATELARDRSLRGGMAPHRTRPPARRRRAGRLPRRGRRRPRPLPTSLVPVLEPLATATGPTLGRVRAAVSIAADELGLRPLIDLDARRAGRPGPARRRRDPDDRRRPAPRQPRRADPSTTIRRSTRRRPTSGR